jgi:hypothetical protein
MSRINMGEGSVMKSSSDSTWLKRLGHIIEGIVCMEDKVTAKALFFEGKLALNCFF